MRSWLKGRGKGEHLGQEAGMWEGQEEPEAWQPEELRAVLPGCSLEEVAQGSWSQQQRRRQSVSLGTPVRSLDLRPKGRGAFEG